MTTAWELFPIIVGLLWPRRNTEDKTRDRDRSRRIRCPVCEWQPQRKDRWSCAPVCGHVWNTFETEGRCPRCSRQWEHTQCLNCGSWSPHRDWYVPGEDDGGDR